MESLVQIGLSNALVALVLAAIAALVGVLVRKPALTHGLWLLVLVKLVTPPLFTIPISWNEPPSRKAEVEAILAALPAPEKMGPPALEVVPWGDAEIRELPLEPIPAPVPVVIPAVDPELLALADEPAASLPAVWWQWLGGLWLTGSLAWFSLAFYRVAKFQRLLKAARPAPDWLREQVERLAQQIGLRRMPGVWLVPGRLAPMIWTTPWGPRLLLPADLWTDLPSEQRQTLLVHELAHLRRCDHWVRLLELMTLGLYWWLPIVWVACRQLREAEEQCCDAWVVSTLSGARRTYAEALVETLDFLAGARTPEPLLASGVGPVSDLKRRLAMILRGTTPRALSWRGVLGLLTLAAFLLPALPVFGQPGGADRDQAAAIKELREKLAELEKKVGRPTEPPKVDAEALKKAEAELKDAQAALEKKAAEMRELSKKVAEAQEKVLKAGGRVEAQRAIRVEVVGQPGQGGLFRVEPLPGQPRDVLFLRKFEGPEADRVIKLWGMPPGEPGGPARIEMRPPQPGQPGQPGRVIEAKPLLTPQAGTDRRIEGLERQLGEIRRMLEEMRQGPGRPPGQNPPPGGRPGQPNEPGRPGPGAGPMGPGPMGPGPMGPGARPEQPRQPNQPGQPGQPPRRVGDNGEFEIELVIPQRGQAPNGR